MALPSPSAIAVDVSLSSSSSYYYNYSCMWWRRSTTTTTTTTTTTVRTFPILVPQSHPNATTTTNLKFKHITPSSLSSPTSVPTILHFMSSITNNLFGFHNTTGGISCYAATTATDKNDKHRQNKRMPYVLLFDIMDTIVRDPFYQDVPAFFQMSLKELIDCKHPTAWVEFELGSIDEMELARRFFKDGRPLDLEGLKNCMRRGYSYIEGVEELLRVLKQNNYEMHALTNYPIWYEMIEEKLKLSKYLSWSFCSCTIGKRKPDKELYAEVVRLLDVEPGNCIFIDDRMRNVEAAAEAGMVGLQFKDAEMLRHDLSMLGIQTKSQEGDIES